MKSKFERIQNELELKIATVLDYDCREETPETDTNRPKRQSLKGDSLLLPHQCIFCKKKNKYVPRFCYCQKLPVHWNENVLIDTLRE